MKKVLNIHSSHKPQIYEVFVVILLLAILQLIMAFTPSMVPSTGIPFYLPLHTTLEISSIVISMMIFAVGWNKYNTHATARVLFISCSFFAVGMFDLLHAISYTSMPAFVTENDTTKHLNFWLAARVIAAISLFTVVFNRWQEISDSQWRRYGLFGFTIVTITCITTLVLFSGETLPVWFTPDQGLTPLKKNVEYFVIAVHIITALALLAQLKDPNHKNLSSMIAAVTIMAAGELYFTWYSTMVGEYNVLGHMYKTIAYFYLYRAIVVDVIETPFTQLATIVHTDQLTGLANRTHLEDKVRVEVAEANQTGSGFALMFLDLDNFKVVNDTLGHDVGDKLLIKVSNRLVANVREQDLVARMGGDEFVIMIRNVDHSLASIIAEKIIKSVSSPYSINEDSITVTASIGVAVHDRDGKDFKTLCRHADTAMYKAKQAGKNAVKFFTQDMQDTAIRNSRIESILRSAIANNYLTLHYQPQIDIKTGHIVGAEALLRLSAPDTGIISPSEFIPIAEASGLIVPIGEWVLLTAATQMKSWIGNDLDVGVMAVNMSAVQLRKKDIAESVFNILHDVGLSHDRIEIELTESVAVDMTFHYIEVMNKFKSQHIKMSIDDFGTGYSSLSQLTKFKCDKLKIDQSFVGKIYYESDRAIVETIIEMAHIMGFKTIAEGVETYEQLALLKEANCDEIQGYLVSKPLTAANFELFARKYALEKV